MNQLDQLRDNTLRRVGFRDARSNKPIDRGLTERLSDAGARAYSTGYSDGMALNYWDETALVFAQWKLDRYDTLPPAQREGLDGMIRAGLPVVHIEHSGDNDLEMAVGALRCACFATAGLTILGTAHHEGFPEFMRPGGWTPPEPETDPTKLN